MIKKINASWVSTLYLLLVSFTVFANQNQLETLDFRTDAHKNAKVIIELSQDSIAFDIQPSKTGLSVDLLQTKVDDEKLYILDVTDFATSVEQIEVFRNKQDTRLDIKVRGDFDFEFALNGRFLEITINKASKIAAALKNPPSNRKEKKLSINFQDIPIRRVLQLIADHNHFNLVVADSVQGNLTLRLDGVPWRQALDIILQVKGLDKRVKNNVILVAPKSELNQQEKRALERAEMAKNLGKLHSEVIEIKFAKASDIKDILTGDNRFSLLSDRGSVSVDDRTNLLLINELPQSLKAIKQIVKSLDVPVKQVHIEARIVTIAEGDLDELGVRWGFSKTSGSLSTSGSIEGNVDNNVPLNDKTDIDDFLNVNLGASSPNASSIAFQIAKLGKELLIDLELSALQTESKAEIISSPRLITTDKKAAYIEQGTEIPFTEASSSGATAISFKKAVLGLKVVPQITPDNRLVLDLEVTQDKVGKVVKSGEGEAVSIDTQRIATQVLVNNGETVVLGGIYQQSTTKVIDKIPFLGDIPYLGVLFRRHYEQIGKSELLIFITPKIVAQ